MIRTFALVGERWALALRYVVCLVCAFQTAVAQEPAPSPQSIRQELIVVVGAPGTDEYRVTFESWAARWKVAAERAAAGCTLIGAGDHSTSDLEALTASLAASIGVETTEPLWIVFIGHGTFDGRTASLNLNGPDVSSQQMAEMLRPAKRPIAFIACASCSSPFINALSAPDRIVISATKDGNQIQYSRFGDAMSQAIDGLDADINRDGQTSLLEAWLFASRRTAEFYTTEGRLVTEHALLDDNGDSKGTRAEVYEADRLKTNIENADQLDGAQAARWHLVRSDEERRLTPEQRKTRDDLEQQLEKLRPLRDKLDEADYLLQLEAILVPLARLYESIDSSEAAAEPQKK
ncbi:MAG: hypothetical protein H7Z17_00985 [Fuerstia sp.]|nr:hypothetical protein [Fuerstiella sp.]